MCTTACLAFAARMLGAPEVTGKDILEVGSYDTTGSVRPAVVVHDPRSYLGVDIVPGPAVDTVCDVYDLEAVFGSCSFDIVISTEMVEHVRDWRRAFANMIAVLRPGGLLVITTRSGGFRYHFGPRDYWRYEPSDMASIAKGLEIVAVETDPVAPGVFLAARKRTEGHPDWSDIALYSMVKRSRVLDVTDADIRRFEWTTPLLLAYRLPRPLRRAGKRIYEAVTRREL